MMRCSSPRCWISVPEYLPKSTRSPLCTARGRSLPSSLILPSPTAMTLPSWGFSLAVSGMMSPPLVFFSSSVRLTRIRSCSGLTFMGRFSFGALRSRGLAHGALGVDVELSALGPEVRAVRESGAPQGAIRGLPEHARSLHPDVVVLEQLSL